MKMNLIKRILTNITFFFSLADFLFGVYTTSPQQAAALNGGISILSPKK